MRARGGSPSQGGPFRAVVMGWPVEGSLSPAIHNAAFGALGLPWRYEALAVRPGELPKTLRELAADPLFRGANVTMPHKEQAASLVDSLSADARLLAAVNTVVVETDSLSGHNTDAPGFGQWLVEGAGFEVSGRRGLLLGAGGAARACALALARGGMAELVVAARDRSKGQRLAARLAGFPTDLRVVRWEDAVREPADLIVNATPVTEPRDMPLPRMGSDTMMVDLAYRPKVTPLMEAARRAGARVSSGLGMLVRQAELSFELWTGRPPPEGVMSRAAVAALEA